MKEVSGEPLRSCELKLIQWIRRRAVPYGTVTAQLQVEFQDNVPVMVRLVGPLMEEEKLR